MADSTIVEIAKAVIIGLPPTIVALAAWRQGIANGKKAEILDQKVIATADKADTIITKTAEIHTLADGNLSRVSAALDLANKKIEGLEKLVTTIIGDRRAGDQAPMVERRTTTDVINK